jgi:hypothetical protein
MIGLPAGTPAGKSVHSLLSTSVLSVICSDGLYGKSWIGQWP